MSRFVKSSTALILAHQRHAADLLSLLLFSCNLHVFGWLSGFLLACSFYCSVLLFVFQVTRVLWVSMTHWSYFMLQVQQHVHHAVKWFPWQALKLQWLLHPRHSVTVTNQSSCSPSSNADTVVQLLPDLLHVSSPVGASTASRAEQDYLWTTVAVGKQWWFSNMLWLPIEFPCLHLLFRTVFSARFVLRSVVIIPLFNQFFDCSQLTSAMMYLSFSATTSGFMKRSMQCRTNSFVFCTVHEQQGCSGIWAEMVFKEF